MTTIETSQYLDTLSDFRINEIPLFYDAARPDEIADLVSMYNALVDVGGKQSIYNDLPSVVHSKSGIDCAIHGSETSELVVVMANPFATDLSKDNLFKGRFLYDSLRARGVVDKNGITPQVIQTASPSKRSDIPLNPIEHIQLLRGSLDPVARKISNTVCEMLPSSERVVSLGYSLSGFLTPDILLQLGKNRDVAAGFISNSPGAVPESMTHILKKFSKSGSKMFEHVTQSGLKLLIPDVIGSCATRLASNIDTISDVIARPTNLGLWSCFSRGKLFDRIENCNIGTLWLTYRWAIAGMILFVRQIKLSNI